MAYDDRLVEVLRHCHDRGLGVGEALRHGATEGVAPEALLEHMAPAHVDAFDADAPLWWFDDADEDWVAALVEVAGDPSGAQAILDRTARWSGFDVARHLRLSDLLRRVHAALDRRAPIAEIAALVGEAGGALDHLLRDVARRWPIGEVVTSRHLPLDVLREELPRRGSWPDLADAVFAELADDVAVVALGRVLGRPLPDEPALAAVHLRVALQEEALRPLSELTAFASARLTLPRWLAVFRLAGFEPELAALAAVDREADLLDAARALRIGGYGEVEILRGLRACVGDEPVLDVLRAADWEPARLVGALRAAGFLDPEIREHLRQLGVPIQRAAALLGTALAVAGVSPGSAGGSSRPARRRAAGRPRRARP